MGGSEAAGIGILMLLLWILLIFCLFIFWITSLVEVIKNEYTENNKITWIILLLIIPPLGTLLYMIIGKSQIKNYKDPYGNTLSKIDRNINHNINVKPIQTDLELNNKEMICALCNKPMKLRTRSNGEYAGKKYHVCIDYPNCRNVIEA